MEDRNKKIIARVRDKLKQIGNSQIQNDDIYDYASMVIDDMLQEMKCKQIPFNIITKSGLNEYSLKNKHALFIKEIFNSWDGNDLKYEPNWKSTVGMTGSYPLFYHIFGEKLYLAPTPSNDDDIITVWAYQTSQKNPMDEDFEPETPASIDNVLVLGICAEFDENFRNRYEIEKARKTSLFHTKITANRKNQPTW